MKKILTFTMVVASVFSAPSIVFAHYESARTSTRTPVRVVDNTGGYTNHNAYTYPQTSSVSYPYMSPNTAKRRVQNRRVATRNTTPYRRETVVQLEDDRSCEWVTYFDKYFDGYGWVDNERIVRACNTSDAYNRYFARDARRNIRYTTNSYNNYDSYNWSDGYQNFNSYGW